MSSIEEKFSKYYEGWLNQLETHLQNLVLDRQQNYNGIVAILTTHHKDYYTAKWAFAHEDVLAFFSPQWLSPLESAFSWVTGWKPTTVFRLVETLRQTRAPVTSLVHLTDDQAQRISDLMVKIKCEEGRVEREMERQQVALGDRSLSQMAQAAGKKTATELSRDGAVKGILDRLEKVMKMGDYVRLKTLKGVLDVLSPKQGVDFLAMFAMVQLQMRKWGKQRSDMTNTITLATTSTSLVN